MKDIQSLEDTRRIDIKKVGVKTISYPVTVRDKAKKQQQTIATVNMYVNLPHKFKGTHMSRFVEILNQYHGAIDIKNFSLILQDMKKKLDAEASHMEIAFPYFFENKHYGEILNVRRYNCMMCGSLESTTDLEFKVDIPIYLPTSQSTSTPLPSSKGNWGKAVVAARFNSFMWIEDLIEIIEQRIAGEVEKAGNVGDKALSVETLTHGLADCLSQQAEIRSYRVRVENLCDDYSTFAMIES